ncbi:protein DMP8-like [Amaranthus tricolor]|uniref:protein DMP8-like n=1 Tax=Amaranthus tricolor TaxID=29722 RepID=UPI002588348F|nr:protein DMP8-like [Amaranthus tricolor]
MEQITEQPEFGIRIYTASPSLDFTLPSSTPPPPSDPATQPVAPKKRRAAVAKSVQGTLSKTSMLAHFLPTGTLLTFEMVLPSIYGVGECSSVATIMTSILIVLCALSCFFFHFTDSFRTPDGKVYYGFVTRNGLAVFKPGLDVEVPKDDKYNIHFADFVHAMMSVMVFMAIALSDHRVTNCLLPGHGKEMEEAMESFPLMVGIVCSCLFLVFPKARFGVGCMAT